MATADLFGLVHIKSSFDSWEKLFLSNPDNRAKAEAGQFIYAKVSDQLAMVMLKGADLAEMAARMKNPEFAKMVAQDVEKHEMFTLQPMGPPPGA
jgi:hypothetical protein